MDAYCAANKPVNKSLTNIHAFVSFSTTDEIRDMPDNYGYNAYKPVFLMVHTGGNLYDGLITDSFQMVSATRKGPITWANLAGDSQYATCYLPVPFSTTPSITSWLHPGTQVWIGSYSNSV